jgi:hypothetical protein
VITTVPRARPRPPRCGRSRCRTAAAFLFGAAFLSPASAHAQTGEPVRLVYAAPAGCPTASDFRAQVEARTTRFLPAGASGAARSFAVWIASGAQGARGTLVIREIDGREATREVPGEDCGEVAAALALVVAVAIDADAQTAPIAPPPRPEPPAAPSIALLPMAPPPPPTDASPPRSMARARPPTSRFRLAGGSHVAVTGAVAPDPVVGLQLVADLTRFADQGLTPSVRLSFMRGQSGLTSTQVGRAKFTWLAGRLELCPGTWPGSALSLRAAGAVRFGASPCALLDAGSLRAEGSQTVDAATETRPWVAPGLLGRLQLALFDTLLVEAEVGGTFPLLGYRYYFGPATTVFTVPPAALMGGIGLGVRFP